MSIANERRDYSRNGLRDADATPDPLDLFSQWLNEAVNAELDDATAMTLATSTPDGKPSARVVLLKGLDDNGFVFFTNYESRKGQELADNPHAALVFFWPAFERQVRITGIVSKSDHQTAETYFQSRPRQSQISAWASPQSKPVENREALEKAADDVAKLYVGQDNLPLPPTWGGYCLKPEVIEFWQGRPSRLHDRLLYTRQADNSWKIERLAP